MRRRRKQPLMSAEGVLGTLMLIGSVGLLVWIMFVAIQMDCAMPPRKLSIATSIMMWHSCPDVVKGR